MGIVDRLQRGLHQFSKAERRIAEAILSDPALAVHSTTAQLARRAGVSDPMISRLCRSIGCKSFPELKVELAQGLARDSFSLTEAVSSEDNSASYVRKRINANIAALNYLQGQIIPETVDSAVALMAQARKIEIFGMGGSAAIALDAEHKLFRLGVPTVSYSDNLMQRMSAAAADEGTTVLAISYTGRTTCLIDAVACARANGARVIALTTVGSPLADLADVTITSGAELEDTTIYVPMTTRIVVLTIIDILATGLALARGPAIEHKLRAMKSSLDSTKLPLNQRA